VAALTVLLQDGLDVFVKRDGGWGGPGEQRGSKPEYKRGSGHIRNSIAAKADCMSLIAITYIGVKLGGSVSGS